MKQHLTCCLLAIVFAIQCAAAARADEGEQVDAYVQGELQRQKIPGLALLVIRDGAIVKSQGFGLANVE